MQIQFSQGGIDLQHFTHLFYPFFFQFFTCSYVSTVSKNISFAASIVFITVKTQCGQRSICLQCFTQYLHSFSQAAGCSSTHTIFQSSHTLFLPRCTHNAESVKSKESLSSELCLWLLLLPLQVCGQSFPQKSTGQWTSNRGVCCPHWMTYLFIHTQTSACLQ